MEKVAWHDAYPKPRNQSPDVLQQQELLDRFQKGDESGVQFLLVDLRRTDHEVSRPRTWPGKNSTNNWKGRYHPRINQFTCAELVQ